MLQIQKYVKVQSVEEAYELNQKKNNVIIGGMHWLKMGSRNMGTAIDLSGLGLDCIEETEDAFEIGCMVTLRQLELHEGLNRYTSNAVRDAVKDIVGIQFRNTATAGGSIFGRYGFSDVLTVFMAMDAYVVCHKAGVIPIYEYANMKADRDILIKIIVKKTPIKMAYQAMRHARTDFPMLTCAASYMSDRWNIVIGARPSRAKLVADETGLGLHVTEEEARSLGESVSEKMTYGSNMRGSADYRKSITPVLVKRAMMAAGKEC